MEVCGTYGISIDRDRLNSNEAKTLLFHEIGHCETNSFYNEHMSFDIRMKHENRADKWAIEKLVPKAELDNAIEQGYVTIWDLSEYFGVTEDFMKKAVCWYTHGNLAADLYF